MSEFKSAATVVDLETLDQADVLAGYYSGLNGDPAPGSDKSRGFFHGWRNGMADTRRTDTTPEQQQLCREMVDTGYFKPKH